MKYTYDPCGANTNAAKIRAFISAESPGGTDTIVMMIEKQGFRAFNGTDLIAAMHMQER